MILEVGEFGFMAQQFDQLISYPPTIRIPLSTRTPVTFTPSKSIIYLGRTTWMSSMIWGCQALIVQPPCLFCVQKNAVQKCASRDSLNSTRDYQLISFFFQTIPWGSTIQPAKIIGLLNVEATQQGKITVRSCAIQECSITSSITPCISGNCMD